MGRICELIANVQLSLPLIVFLHHSTEFLLSKGYSVHGLIRRSSSFNTGRLHHLYEDQHERAFHPTTPCFSTSGKPDVLRSFLQTRASSNYTMET